MVVIQPIAGHPHGHIALFNGSHWVSDFVQLNGFYPGPSYRNVKPAYILYRYAANEETEETEEANEAKTPLKKICYPIAKMSGQEFTRQEEILAHLAGESTGLYMIGRNGMWHGGIHITQATTPWCALSGKTQPTGLIRNVFQSQLDAAKDDTRVSHALVPFNYQRLLKKIDSGASDYSAMEYLRALHNPSYRDVLQKTIVKHPSDWYHKKSDSIWQTFLEPLKKEAPEWKKYSEAFLDKMAWMQEVTTEKLGPSLWHMHPVMFLGALKERTKLIWIKVVEKRFGGETAEAFKLKVIEVGKDLSIDPNYIMACMALETGEKFNTSTKNPHSSATGLIQFMADTAKDLGTTTQKLSEMTHIQQMDYVKKYFEVQANNFNYATREWSLGDVYLSIFTPAAMLLKDNDIVYATGQRAYAVNLYHDRNKDGRITKREIVKNIEEFYVKGFNYEG